MSKMLVTGGAGPDGAGPDGAGPDGAGPDGCRLPRVAFMLLQGLDHFAHDLITALEATGAVSVRAFRAGGDPAPALAAALAWTDRPGTDSVWFEFCWPPFPELVARTQFGGRRVVVRVHRIEAYGTEHAARAPWHKVDDAVVVGEDMARRLRAAAPGIAATTRLHVVHNGLDLARYSAAEAPDPFGIGWCGAMTLHKNPNLALEVLTRLRVEDPRYELRIATKGGEPVAVDSFLHLAGRLGLRSRICVDEKVSQDDMPAWHARNGVLLSTSVYESFGYAIAEAAAVGCDLAVLDNAAAGEFWPQEALFATVDDAVGIIRAARPHRWRSYVAGRFSLERQAAATLDVLLAPRAPRRDMDGVAGGTAVRERAVPLSHGDWHGVFLVRDAADHVQAAVAASSGFYEAGLLEDVRTRLEPGALFVDVGANVGNHALFAAAVCGARVIAFEPSLPLAAHCEANLRANGVEASVSLIRQGVAARGGHARLQPGPAGNSGMTRLDVVDTPSAAAGDGYVELTSLDDTLGRLGAVPAVIKVDVEGMEAEVLRGAAGSIARCRPTIYVEAADEEALDAVRGVLDPLGYLPAARFNATPTYLFLPRDRPGREARGCQAAPG